jgi:hypothetical protein
MDKTTKKICHSSLLVYLDWNIVIALAEGGNESLLAALAAARDKGHILVVFSAAHVQEADLIADNPGAPAGLSVSRLRFLSELTHNAYLYNAADKYSPCLRVEDPEIVRQTINGVSFAKPAMQAFVNMFGFDQMKVFRQELQLSPAELNNIKPPNVIDKLDRTVTEKASGRFPELTSGFGVRALLETVVKYFPASAGYGIENKMAAAFSGLNFLGFWPDNAKKTTPIASFHDSMHAGNAALCSYFVTEDKALRIKTQAVYELFGVETEVVDIAEISSVLASLDAQRSAGPA